MTKKELLNLEKETTIYRINRFSNEVEECKISALEETETFEREPVIIHDGNIDMISEMSSMGAKSYYIDEAEAIRVRLKEIEDLKRPHNERLEELGEENEQR